MCLRFWRL
ncbi:unnamed protein product [Linum tenue]|uniref:Uncharacterized protein n=1 Tax=Linum tenue TaxID=586396 RepID=A0AAV0IAS1_9ROSI|nr:unnamed protein product [Linum tenue]